MISDTNFDLALIPLIAFRPMIGIAALLALINQVSGTPYIPGGDSPAGTDCSGLASWISNAATDRPVFGDRFNTGNEEAALMARGFHYGTAPNALVIGWNGGHTAVTLPDGTPVSSGEGGGVRIGGGGAYQPQFTHHMFLPMDPAGLVVDAPPLGPPPMDPPPPGAPALDVPPPGAPAPDAPPPGAPALDAPPPGAPAVDVPPPGGPPALADEPAPELPIPAPDVDPADAPEITNA
ncbi:peptidoglycan endopeptidase [Mycobacterium spongiae]|uniref:peptidoglycan endopeptidase n=1 Tax=Mycobacterium spongiae TaxID=886343 RepID=UPI003CCEF3FB